MVEAAQPRVSYSTRKKRNKARPVPSKSSTEKDLVATLKLQATLSTAITGQDSQSTILGQDG